VVFYALPTSRLIKSTECISVLATKFLHPSTKFLYPSTKFLYPPTKFLYPPTKFLYPSTKFLYPSTKFLYPSTKFLYPSTKFIYPSTKFLYPSTPQAPKNTHFSCMHLTKMRCAICSLGISAGNRFSITSSSSCRGYNKNSAFCKSTETFDVHYHNEHHVMYITCLLHLHHVFGHDRPSSWRTFK